MTDDEIIEIAAGYSEQDNSSTVSFYPSNLLKFARAIEAARATAEQSPMHVGDSKFEEWFARHPTGQHMPKQFGRDAYEAGLNERATAEQRDSVIEECAKVAEAHADGTGYASDCTAAIRALKSQQDAAIESQRSGDGS